MPSRGCVYALRPQTIIKLGALRLNPPADKEVNSGRLRSRSALVKVGMCANCMLLGSYGNGQALSALCTTTLDDKTTVFGGHANEKAVRAGATGLGSLVGAFHGGVVFWA